MINSRWNIIYWANWQQWTYLTSSFGTSTCSDFNCWKIENVILNVVCMYFWAPEKLHFSWKSGPKYVWIMIQKYNGCVYNPTTLSDIKNRILQSTTNSINDSPEWKIIAVIGNINHMKSVFLMALSIRSSIAISILTDI